MKRCPECRRDYYDDTLLYCLDDGNALLEGPALADEPKTAILSKVAASEAVTREEKNRLDKKTALRSDVAVSPVSKSFDKRLILTVFALAMIVLGGFFGYRYFNKGTSEQINSIAVLPFENRSGNADTDYLSDGLPDSLIYRLSQLPNLKVSPTSSVMRYRGKDTDVAQIARDLEVDAVMSGRLVQLGDDLSISVQLINSRTGKLIWAEQYDRKMADLLATQREIAAAITEKLQLKLSGDDARGITKRYTESSEAYQLYLKARFFWNKRTGDDIAKSIEFLNQSIALDPNFALAYAALADSYVVPANPLPPREKMPKSEAAARRALELDDSLAEAHTSLARALTVYEWDWKGAEAEFRRAIELNPRYSVAHQWYGSHLEAMGRFDESLSERRKALALDPLSPAINFELGILFYYSRDYDRSLEQFRKTLELDPDFPLAHAHLPAAYEQKGMYAEAIAGLKKGASYSGGTEWNFAMGSLGHTYAISGNKREALIVLDELEKASRERYVPADAIALVYAGLGEKDEAFARLERAYNDRSFKMAWLKVEPEWDSLRTDPRFTVLMRKMGLSE